MICTPGYRHGPSDCSLCFATGAREQRCGDWQLVRNPGYYGSHDPETLILGFSKGATQNHVAQQGGDFDRIAFAGARHRLREVLERLGLMPADRGIDALMTASEPDFGVASLLRCSLGHWQQGRLATSGPLIARAFIDAQPHTWLEACTRRWLTRLPGRLRRIVLLGNGDRYIADTGALLARLHPDYRQLNAVACRAGGVLWVHAAHPSPGNGHFNRWSTAPADDAQGRKRELAIAALRSTG